MTFQRIVCVIGLGYVGLSTAVAFSKISKVIAYDCSAQRIKELNNGHDANNEVTDTALGSPNLQFSSNPEDLKEANFFIITVPTPVNKLKQPDLSMVLGASSMLGAFLKDGDIVVYESTVYPGATEEQCIPALERSSGLRCGVDFSVGFSPERINPADKDHVFDNIVKIVSGSDKRTLDIIADAYGRVVSAGVFPVSSIKTAEAAKVIENTQRDVNIALMNDIAIIMHALEIDTSEVIAAMRTKWNYIPFQPGLVGGHCIGVNSYYLMHKAEEAHYYSDIIHAARRVNESIGQYIVSQTVKQLIHLNVLIKGAKVAVLGLTYKENCTDLRDSGVISIINELKTYQMDVLIHDPIANHERAKKEYGVDLVSWDDLFELDAIIIAVAHQQYSTLSKAQLFQKLKAHRLMVDLKKVLNIEDAAGTSTTLWRL